MSRPIASLLQQLHVATQQKLIHSYKHITVINQRVSKPRIIITCNLSTPEEKCAQLAKHIEAAYHSITTMRHVNNIIYLEYYPECR